MLSQIEEFVNWLRRRNHQGRTWRDYGIDLLKLVALWVNTSGSFTYEYWQFLEC